MSEERYKIVNLGAVGETGESTFSVIGIPYASQLIEQGWIPCGTYKSERQEIMQAFYLPKEIEL